MATAGRFIKEEMFKAFEEKVLGSHSIILCKAQGLKAGEINELRAKMKRENIELFLIKKTLANLAFKKINVDASSLMDTDTFYAFAKNDPINASKILTDFAFRHEGLKIKGGIIDKKIVGGDQIKRYSGIPAREVLLQGLVLTIMAPLTNLAVLLNAPVQKLVIVLGAIKQEKEKKV